MIQQVAQFVFPDGRACPPLLTAPEAAELLRLDEGRDETAAVKAINRLVERGLLHPTVVGRHRRYALAELLRFIDATTQVEDV